MVNGTKPQYARNYMQSWTEWFRMKQSEFGTIEDFARKSGLSVRMVNSYRAGTIPRRQEKIDKIVAALGEAGPLPGPKQEELRSLDSRVAQLESTITGMRGAMLAVFDQAVQTLDQPEINEQTRRAARESFLLAVEMLELTGDEAGLLAEGAIARARARIAEAAPGQTGEQREGRRRPRPGA